MKPVMITNGIKWRIFAAIMCLVGYSSLADAQNVTISPTSGNFISAYTVGSEFGFDNGANSMWRHSQLPLTMITADNPALADGQLCVHADNVKPNGSMFALFSTGLCYTTLSLPKGYRFTSYKIVIGNYVSENELSTSISIKEDQPWNFYETKSTWSKDDAYESQSLGTWATSNADNKKDFTFTITRTSHSNTDMGNILYFLFDGNKKPANGDASLGGIYIKSFEVTFAPDDAFTPSVAPNTTNAAGVNYVNSPFNTGKTDIGPLNPHSRSTGGKEYYTYEYLKTSDLQANNVLYESTCVSGGKLPSAPSAGSITSLCDKNGKYYYGLTANNLYYVETPTSATGADGHSSQLLGYRITGAKINYAYADGYLQTTTNDISSGYYITYTTSEGMTLYLNTKGQFVNYEKTKWKRDNQGRISSGGYYLYWSNSGLRTTTKSNDADDFYIDSNNRVYYSGWRNNYYIIGNTSGSYPELSTNSDGAAKWQAPTKLTTASTATKHAASFKLTVYDKNGENGQTVTVDANNASNYVELSGLNNDAIKFEISDLDTKVTNPAALVNVELTLEPLNPYVQSMNVVANAPNCPSISQFFQTTDFKLGGDKFTYYVPEGYGSKTWAFSFDNLRSKYADDTYGPRLSATGNSRYNFVKSAYYNTVNEDLYANKNEVADHVYTDKVKVGVAGTQPFRFDNADVLKNTGGVTSTDYLTEYPFSVSNYQSQTIPANGAFEAVQLIKDGTSTHYLFVEDETRYNIAPTTATQHKYYAYYQVGIELKAQTYTAKVEWDPIYATSLYDNGTKRDYEPTRKPAGAKITTSAVLTTDANGNPIYGFLTAEDIQTAMQTSINNNADSPASLKDVLYVDCSSLYAVAYTPATGDKTTDGMQDFQSSLGGNALIYLPKEANYVGNNFAYKTASDAFQACENIVLVDKQPFYAPHEIQVDAASYASYTRQITATENQQAILATLMLPFTMTVTDGVHTNADGKCAFTVNKMRQGTGTGTNQFLDANYEDISGHEGRDFKTIAYYDKITGDETEANVPYFVQVAENSAVRTNTGISFIATQYGSKIVATPSKDVARQGETASGTITDKGTYTFTNYGTYAGQKLAKTSPIFYFGNNCFYSSQNLTGDWLYVYPFRSYYEYTGPNAASKLSIMDVAFGENNSTGIETAQARQEADFAVTTGYGYITAVAKNDARLNIHNLTGQSVANTTIKAGETLTFNVPAGMYIINGQKVLVK